ncbi:farnesyl diphosphate synthase [Alteromonas lipolytica]|uniref:Geranyl transferase n=1 Tax=Alteromonas lipolytica TaxID=1856405 RepID=A0A1E8F9A0_9ALTE|nr:farnesyl diphosphate synthase [Alteromonas lipolytica]OFI32492.1 geranyl transferase [Alteromonas lipolytica]GGF75745.1 (2E,6E)-farnesyl diphosphate synthase [Alteromonas lipolytica]
MQLASLHQLIKERIDASLQDTITQLDDAAPQLKQAMLYALTNGGKRMRPLLVHLTGNMLDIPDNDQRAISMAIECIHAYSLVHDDLPAMDDDDLRRGNPTCHIAFNEATAILAGDALQTQAFTILAEHPMSNYANQQRAKLVATLARAAGYQGMCGGQAIDLAATGKAITLDQLKQLHQLKTGALLTACVEMVCQVTEQLPRQHQQALCRFASLIGLAFQVQDDILDVTATTETLGKPMGSDEAQGKNTFPSLLGLEGARQELAKLHQEALQALAGLPYNTDYLVAFTDLMVSRSH